MVNKKKILILSYNYPPDISAGAFRTQALTNELLKRKNISIHIITSVPNRYNNFNPKIDKNTLEDKNIKLTRIKNVLKNRNIFEEIVSYLYFFIKAIIIAKNKKYDLVYSTSSRLFTGFLGSIISRLYSIPHYLDIRDIFLDTIQYTNKKFYYFVFIFLNKIEHFTLSNAKHINFVSEGFKKYYINKIDINKASFFTNGIDDVFLDLYKNNYQEKRIPNKKIHVLYVGNIGDGQGLEKIIPNILLYKSLNISFKIIGGGRRLKHLKKIIKKNNIKNCIFLDPVKRNHLLDEYRNTDLLFLHLNNYKAFNKVLPSKIFEYAITGKPILAGIDGYAKKFLSENISNVYIFNPCDHLAAISLFDEIDYKIHSRKEFKNKFSRKNITLNLVNSILKQIDE